MSRKRAHSPVAILATIAGPLSISVATAASTAAEPHTGPISTGPQTVNLSFADARFHHAGWRHAGGHRARTGWHHAGWQSTWGYAVELRGLEPLP